MTMLKEHHPCHLVEMSPWPLSGSISAMMVTTGLVKWFHQFNMDLLMLGLVTMLLTMYQWWRDITRESTLQGYHTFKVAQGLRWGMILFIASEVLFFVSFFWTYFHSSLSPSVEVGMCWPPAGIQSFEYNSIPLLNTSVLIASGVTITWSHHAIQLHKIKPAIFSLAITVALGIYFSLLQALEYMEATFTIADSVYGCSFFVATGFHGLHVLIGTTFLAVCLYRLKYKHFSSKHHFGFEAAAWYWHFVDVVWLFLFVSIYWWGE